MKKLLKLKVILIVILLTSCEGNTDIYRYVKNNGSQPINLKVTLPGGTNYEKVIQPKQSDMFYLGGLGLGGSGTPINPSDMLENFIITNINGDSCQKNEELSSNWTNCIEQTRKIPSNWKHEYTFAVSDSDFQ